MKPLRQVSPNKRYVYYFTPANVQPAGNWDWIGTVGVLIMHQSIPAAPSSPTSGLLWGICPPCQSCGWGICKFCAARGPGICQARAGPAPSFWHARGFLLEYNYTEDFTGKTSRLAHLSRTGKIEEVCKDSFSILCMHFFIAYQARVT